MTSVPPSAIQILRFRSPGLRRHPLSPFIVFNPDFTRVHSIPLYLHI